MKTSKQIFILLVLGVLVSSCDPSVIYEEQKDLKGQQWHKDSVLTYSFEADTMFCEAIKFSFNIRHNVDYAYKNMWLFVNIDMPNHEPIVDTINLEFMDKHGNWRGYVKGGTIKESKHYYRYGIPNPQKGVYKIVLRHGMRTVLLENVVSVGARIEKLTNE
jgi:gliding motility-associated lipoprotein GldH